MDRHPSTCDAFTEACDAIASVGVIIKAPRADSHRCFSDRITILLSRIARIEFVYDQVESANRNPLVMRQHFKNSLKQTLFGQKHRVEALKSSRCTQASGVSDTASFVHHRFLRWSFKLSRWVDCPALAHISMPIRPARSPRTHTVPITIISSTSTENRIR